MYRHHDYQTMKTIGTCYRDAERAAGAADSVLYPWERKDISTFWAEVGITIET